MRLFIDGCPGGRPEAEFIITEVTEMCSGSEAGSYFRLIDFAYHSTLGLRVIQKEKTRMPGWQARSRIHHHRGKGLGTTPESSKGSPKVISPSRQLFSKVKSVSGYAFDCIYPLQHSGVAVGCQ